ncbi:MAG: DUF6220 domain-containing protein [Cyanobacteria bacterium P01_A01_bin.123]
MDSSPDLSKAIATQPAAEIQALSQPAVVGFFSFAVLFNLCLTAQVLTVGLAYFYSPGWWQAHVWLVRGYSGLSLILLAWAYGMPFSQRIRALTISFPILLGLQFLTIHTPSPLPFPLAIFHPLIGFSLFTASSTLVHRMWRILKSNKSKVELKKL